MSLDELFRSEILEDLEEDTMFDEDDSLVEASMSEHELTLLDEIDESTMDDKDLEEFLDLDENDEIDDLMDMEDITYE